MGASQSRSQCQVAWFGPVEAGKTTALLQIDGSGGVTEQPTIGFDVSYFETKRMKIRSWDTTDGSDKVCASLTRLLLIHTEPTPDLCVISVDGTNIQGLERRRVTTSGCVSLAVELTTSPLLLFCNKSDLQNSCSPLELVRGLHLAMISRRWLVASSCAVTGENVEAGLERAMAMCKVDAKSQPTGEPALPAGRCSSGEVQQSLEKLRTYDVSHVDMRQMRSLLLQVLSQASPSEVAAVAEAASECGLWDVLVQALNHASPATLATLANRLPGEMELITSGLCDSGADSPMRGWLLEPGCSLLELLGEEGRAQLSQSSRPTCTWWLYHLLRESGNEEQEEDTKHRHHTLLGACLRCMAPLTMDEVRGCLSFQATPQLTMALIVQHLPPSFDISNLLHNHTVSTRSLDMLQREWCLQSGASPVPLTCVSELCRSLLAGKSTVIAERLQMVLAHGAEVEDGLAGILEAESKRLCSAAYPKRPDPTTVQEQVKHQEADPEALAKCCVCDGYWTDIASHYKNSMCGDAQGLDRAEAEMHLGHMRRLHNMVSEAAHMAPRKWRAQELCTGLDQIVTAFLSSTNRADTHSPESQ